MDRAVPRLSRDWCVWRNHLQDDRRIATVDIVPNEKLLDVSAAQLGELPFADLADVLRRCLAVRRPLLVLPRLESVTARIVRVFRHRPRPQSTDASRGGSAGGEP